MMPALRRALLASLLLTACGLHIEQARSDLARNTSPQVPAADAKALIDGNTAFAVDLFKAIRGSENAMISPHSISLALAMTWAGAKGDTETAMATALRFTLAQDQLHPAFDQLDLALSSRGQGAKDKDGQPFKLIIADAAWAQKGFSFQKSYLDTLAVNYDAGVNLLDFAGAPDAAKDTINAWVADQTDDRIKDLFSTIDPATKLVLTNTVYFNAAWRKAFEESGTHDAAFTLADGSSAQVPTMSGVMTGAYAEGADFIAAELPYDGDEVSMVVVLPRTGSLEALVAGLDGVKLEAITGALQPEGIDVRLPKFKFDWKSSLVQPLTSLGMGVAFSDAADFSGMHAGGGLAIADVLHQTFVQVDESGTEAAAATGVVMEPTSIEVGTIVSVDRPFLFLIRDIQTGAVIFLGQVVDPR